MRKSHRSWWNLKLCVRTFAKSGLNCVHFPDLPFFPILSFLLDAENSWKLTNLSWFLEYDEFIWYGVRKIKSSITLHYGFPNAILLNMYYYFMLISSLIGLLNNNSYLVLLNNVISFMLNKYTVSVNYFFFSFDASFLMYLLHLLFNISMAWKQ